MTEETTLDPVAGIDVADLEVADIQEGDPLAEEIVEAMVALAILGPEDPLAAEEDINFTLTK